MKYNNTKVHTQEKVITIIDYYNTAINYNNITILMQDYYLFFIATNQQCMFYYNLYGLLLYI